MAERRAGKFLADIAKLGTGSASALYRARPFPLQAVDGNLVLPEVTDKSKWWQGKHQYADPDGKYILSPCVSVHIDMVSYNTELVKPADLMSYGDILSPKWKGKIGSMDPRAAGGREGGEADLLSPGARTAISQAPVDRNGSGAEPGPAAGGGLARARETGFPAFHFAA